MLSGTYFATILIADTPVGKALRGNPNHAVDTGLPPLILPTFSDALPRTVLPERNCTVPTGAFPPVGVPAGVGVTVAISRLLRDGALGSVEASVVAVGTSTVVGTYVV